jgi:cobalamin synthase
VAAPGGGTVSLTTDQDGMASLVVEEYGLFDVSALRDSHPLAQAEFYGIGGVLTTVFGPLALSGTVQTLDQFGTNLLWLLLLLALLAAIITFKRSRVLFEQKRLSTSAIQRQNFARVALAAFAFALPILLEPTASLGIIAVILEIALVLIFAYYLEKQKELGRFKAVKV